MILDLVAEAVAAGARRWKAAATLGLPVRTLERWGDGGDDNRCGPKQTPPNKLSAAERRRIVTIATSAEFCEQSPKQIVPRLADRGVYVASESSFYRVLHDAKLQHRRGRSRPPTRRPREHVASGPWQVASWDITYLKSTLRGRYFYLYLVEDVWSRKILGWDIADCESPEIAAQLIENIRRDAGVNLAGWVLHSDNGNPMRGATMLATLQRLGVVPSFSRPRVSDDNPYAEALFKTLKYSPSYPANGFDTVDDACAWVAGFVRWYNEEHLHSGIAYVAPALRHAGRDVALLVARRATYERARRRHPQRWSRHTRPWTRPELVTLNPEAGTESFRSDRHAA